MRHSVALSKEAGAEVKSSLGEFAKSTVMGFGAAAGIVGIGEIVKSTIEAAEHIRQLSKEFRVSTDTIQIWEKGAHMAGMTAEDIGNAMNKLKKAREDALSGSATSIKTRDAFGTFGVGIDDLNDKALTTEDIMDRIRDNASGHPITDKEDAEGMVLMGRGGAKVLSAMQEIHDLGPVHMIDKEDIEKLHEADEKLREIKKDLTVGAAQILGGSTKFVDRVAAGVEGVKQFFSGRMSLNESRNMLNDDHGVEAPKVDLKGRPINQGGIAKPIAEPDDRHYAITKVVDLNKDAKEIEKERERLALKISENHFKTLTALQRQAAIKKEIAAHEKEAISQEFQGNDLESIREKLKAEELRGQLKTDHKAERMDFSSAEKIGAFGNVSALHSAGMDHAAKTSQHTHDTFVAVKELLAAFKGYTLKKGDKSRADRTHEALHGVQF